VLPENPAGHSRSWRLERTSLVAVVAAGPAAAPADSVVAASPTDQHFQATSALHKER
jgi:hypothetical protein